MCPHTTTCVHILLCMCPRTTVYVSSYYCMHFCKDISSGPRTSPIFLNRLYISYIYVLVIYISNIYNLYIYMNIHTHIHICKASRRFDIVSQFITQFTTPFTCFFSQKVQELLQNRQALRLFYAVYWTLSLLRRLLNAVSFTPSIEHRLSVLY